MIIRCWLCKRVLANQDTPAPQAITPEAEQRSKIRCEHCKATYSVLIVAWEDKKD